MCRPELALNLSSLERDPWSFDGTKYRGHRQKYTWQLEREVVGLWTREQTSCLGIILLCQNGQLI